MEFSQWSVAASDESFFPYIGMLAGQFVYALGKAELYAMSKVWDRHLRRLIDHRFPHDDASSTPNLDKLYRVLLDFCR
jgi:hypothetical protein